MSSIAELSRILEEKGQLRLAINTLEQGTELVGDASFTLASLVKQQTPA